MRELWVSISIIALFAFVSAADHQVRDASGIKAKLNEVPHFSLAQGSTERSVRDELAKQQKETGLTIAWYDGARSAVSAVSALFWSPDSRFVAYVPQDSFALDIEFYHLMVRRLEHGSEDWLADGVSCCINYQWVSEERCPSIFNCDFG
jgi:hypothetical protein